MAVSPTEFYKLREENKCIRQIVSNKVVEIDKIMLELTKGDDQDYGEYVMSIIEGGSDLARLVKGADMKDHYMLADTMTEKLHKKYQPYLKFFL